MEYMKHLRMNRLPENIRREIRNARRDRGWSQLELGRRAGFTQRHVSGIETGRIVPRYDTLIDLLRVLDRDLALSWYPWCNRWCETTVAGNRPVPIVNDRCTPPSTMTMAARRRIASTGPRDECAVRIAAIRPGGVSPWAADRRHHTAGR